MHDIDAPAGDDPTVQLSRARTAAVQRSDPTTEVMSLDELMDLAASRPATSASAEQAAAEAYPAEPAPAAQTVAEPVRPAAPPRAPMPVVPVRSEPALAAGPTAAAAGAQVRTAPGRTARQDLQRLSEDAAKAYRAAIEQATTWLKAGDNAVIAATAVVAVLLIIVVAAL